jgi:NAD(P)-dependent dehydrogenase (short-subunit alcohol dehydrogenase family)
MRYPSARRSKVSKNQWKSMAAPGRAATPADIAPIVVSLASSDGGWLTGETIDATSGVR